MLLWHSRHLSETITETGQPNPTDSVGFNKIASLASFGPYNSLDYRVVIFNEALDNFEQVKLPIIGSAPDPSSAEISFIFKNNFYATVKHRSNIIASSKVSLDGYSVSSWAPNLNGAFLNLVNFSRNSFFSFNNKLYCFININGKQAIIVSDDGDNFTIEVFLQDITNNQNASYGLSSFEIFKNTLVVITNMGEIFYKNANGWQCELSIYPFYNSYQQCFNFDDKFVIVGHTPQDTGSNRSIMFSDAINNFDYISLSRSVLPQAGYGYCGGCKINNKYMFLFTSSTLLVTSDFINFTNIGQNLNIPNCTKMIKIKDKVVISNGYSALAYSEDGENFILNPLPTSYEGKSFYATNNLIGMV